MNPLIFSTYTDNINIKLRGYHDMVVYTLAQNTYPYISKCCEFWTSNKNILTHGDILNFYINDFFANSNHDVILILDIDCIPLNKEIIDISFDLARKGNIIGNFQKYELRKNSLPYAAPSFLCISKEVFYDCGRPSLGNVQNYDTGEFLTMVASKLNIPIILFPIKKHDYTFDVFVNDLNMSTKVNAGITYEYEGIEATYHLFFARDNLNAIQKNFYEKCQKIILQNLSYVNYKISGISL